MRHGRIIYVLGDVHGNFRLLNEFINKKIRLDKTLRTISPRWRKSNDDLQVLILQCGDFAYFWPFDDSRGAIKNAVEFLPAGYVPIYWTGGNHEDWDELDRLGTDIAEIDKGIFYCPFGSTLKLAPSVTVLFAGGAESADMDWRWIEMKKGAPKIWWEQEGISEEDMARLDKLSHADWIVSHTAPYAFDMSKKAGYAWDLGSHVNEASRGKLERVLVKYEPSRWFFGHFHHYKSGFTDGCEWECLSSLGSATKSWDKVYLEWED